MIDKIKQLRAWADELERVWEDGAARLGLFTHTEYDLPPADTPSNEGAPGTEGYNSHGNRVDPAAPYTGPSDRDMWEPGEPPAKPPTDAVPTSIEAMVALAAEEAGAISPVALEAIERWETGHYKSNLWLQANNPGGIKYRPDVPSLGHILAPYAAKGGTKYARFASQLEGIRAHAKFFLQPRYAKAREATDPLVQIREIHEAGYAEKELAWLNGVTKLARGILARTLLTSKSTGAGGDLPTRIRAAALALPDPFPYEASTEDGELGCANVVSYALIRAGALGKIEVAVRFLAVELKRRRWTATSEPYQDGDVVIWGPRKGGVHGHTGILIVENGAIVTVQNSSSRRKVIHTPLAGYDRPIVEVLRAPKGI